MWSLVCLFLVYQFITLNGQASWNSIMDHYSSEEGSNNSVDCDPGARTLRDTAVGGDKACLICDCGPSLGWVCTVYKHHECQSLKPKVRSLGLRTNEDQEQPCEPGAKWLKEIPGLSQSCHECTCQEEYGWVCSSEISACGSKACHNEGSTEIDSNSGVLGCYDCGCDENGLLRCQGRQDGEGQDNCERKAMRRWMENYNYAPNSPNSPDNRGLGKNFCIFCADIKCTKEEGCTINGKKPIPNYLLWN